MTGGAAKDHLADPALRIGALEQHVGAGGERFLQKRFALRLLPAIGGAQADIDPVPLEGARQFLALGSRFRHVLGADRDDRDMPRPLQKRHAEGDGQRRLGAAVPGYRNDFTHGRGAVLRHHQYRPPALEQRVFERRLGNRSELFRLLDQDQVEHPADQPDDGVLAAVLFAPRCARPVMPGRYRTDRHAAGIHEVAEQTPRLVAAVVTLAFKRAVDLGRDRKPHLAAEHHGIFRRQAVQPDDVAVEALRHLHRGVENRRGIAVADHRQ